MYSERHDEESKQNEVAQLRSENALIYARPSNVALVDRRVFKSYNFSSVVYELGNTFQCILNSGGDAIWGPSSYLRLEYTTSGGMDFGSGSILNIFKSCRVTHRSGEVLEFIDNVNVIANINRFWKYSIDDRRKLDGMLNNNIATGPGDISYTNIQSNAVHIATIPMSILCGIFGNESQYCPATLMAGLKIELELAPLSSISTDPVGTGNMKITTLKPTIVVDSAQLYDVVNKQMLEEQAQVDRSGLQFSYYTYFATFQNLSAGVTAANYDVQQSASLVHKICTFVRDNQKLTGSASALARTDKYDFIAPFSTNQYRLGSLYWPQQIIQTPGGNWDVVQENAKEAYTLSLDGWMAGVDTFHKSAGGEANVSFSEKLGTVTGQGSDITVQCNQWTSGKAAYCFIGEKSACGLELTGEPTNNSRVLNWNGTINSLIGTDGTFPTNGAVNARSKYSLLGGLRVDIFLQYLRVANLMGDNCVVDR